MLNRAGAARNRATEARDSNSTHIRSRAEDARQVHLALIDNGERPQIRQLDMASLRPRRGFETGGGLAVDGAFQPGGVVIRDLAGYIHRLVVRAYV